MASVRPKTSKKRAARAPRLDAELTEQAFLSSYDPSAFERPSLAVDVALLSVIDGALFTLLLQRSEHPFKGKWSLPGGFVRIDEHLEAAARRLLESKGKLTNVFFEQLCTFGDPRRDPRMRVISVAYYALVDRRRFEAAAQGNPALTVARIDVPWEGETGGPVDVRIEERRPDVVVSAPAALAFDHAEILGTAVKRIRGKLDYSPIGFQLLASTFTLLDLQRVHETILGRPLNKDSFRRRMLASGQLEATGETEQAVGHRPAELYRFAKRSAV
jgi:8-oxo-dGTP diphosphatase